MPKHRDAIQLGKLLMQMRDNQAYRLVGPYDTFEEYCKDIEGLNVRYARDKIASYLVHKAIEENVVGGISPPSLQYQVQQFYGYDGAIARFKTERRIIEKRDGTKTSVEVPVSVANPKKVAEQWANTVSNLGHTFDPYSLNSTQHQTNPLRCPISHADHLG